METITKHYTLVRLRRIRAKLYTKGFITPEETHFLIALASAAIEPKGPDNPNPGVCRHKQKR